MTQRSVTCNCRVYFVSSSMVKYKLGKTRRVSLVSFHCIYFTKWWSFSSHAMIHRGNIGDVWQMYSVERRVFNCIICNICVSWKRWCWRFEKNPVSTMPCTGTICRLVVDKYRIRGSVLDSWIWKNFCFFLDDALLTLSVNVNSQNKICWCNKNTHVDHDLYFTLASSAMSTCKIIRHVLCEGTNSNHSVKLIQRSLLFRELTEEDKLRDNAYYLQ